MSKLFRMYVDESGNHNYSDSDDPEDRFLCLTGCIFEAGYYKAEFKPKFEEFKRYFFSKDIDDQIIILHRKELINRSGHFSVLKDAEIQKKFNLSLLEKLSDGKFTIISVVIDKKSHKKRWGSNAAHPYNYCLLAIVQRYVGFLNFYNSRGDVLAESRGGREDMQLKSEYRLLYENGTNFVSASAFQKALTSKEIKLKKKYHDVVGLQVADLFAYPCKQEILLDRRCIDKYAGSFDKKICDIAKTKYNRRSLLDQIDGYGKVFIK